MPRVPSLDWFTVRKPPTVSDYELSTDAGAWLRSVPHHSRPLLTSKRFPHVVNRISERWDNPVELEQYFETLFTDYRGGRQGFPAPITQELIDLARFARQQSRLKTGKCLREL